MRLHGEAPDIMCVEHDAHHADARSLDPSGTIQRASVTLLRPRGRDRAPSCVDHIVDGDPTPGVITAKLADPLRKPAHVGLAARQMARHATSVGAALPARARRRRAARDPGGYRDAAVTRPA